MEMTELYLDIDGVLIDQELPRNKSTLLQSKQHSNILACPPLEGECENVVLG
jgi:hypothetical protein